MNGLIRTFVLVAGIGLPASLTGQSDTIKVALQVDYGDTDSPYAVRSFRDNLISFFRRELRAFDDVLVLPDETDQIEHYRIKVLGMPGDRSDNPITHIFTVGVFDNNACGARLRAVYAGLLAVSDSLVNAHRVGLGGAVADCEPQVFRTIHRWPSDQNYHLAAVRSIVAQIDTQVFESLRNPDN